MQTYNTESFSCQQVVQTQLVHDNVNDKHVASWKDDV